MKTCEECVMKNTDGCPTGCMFIKKACEVLESNTIDASKIKLKPIGFYTGESITNLQMLKDLDAEQLYDKMVWLFQDYGRRFADSRAGIIEWLNSEVEQKEQ